MASTASPNTGSPSAADARTQRIAFLVMVLLLVAAPFVVYPLFLMKALCFALFACAFNLLIGFGGLLSFGHAMFLGTAGYICAHTAKEWGLTPEVAIIAGTLAAATLGALVGLLAIRQNSCRCRSLQFHSPPSQPLHRFRTAL